MKHMNIVVSVIIIAAVLVAAYAVGLLVRHARMQGRQPELVTANEDPVAAVSQQMPGGRSPRGAGDKTSEQMRLQREQMLEKMKSMTEEEKRRFTEEQVRKRFSASGGRTKPRQMSPEEREKLMQKLQSMSEEERKAFESGMREPEVSPGVDGTATPQNPEQGGSQPDKAGPG